jgi:hypothetical protein
MFSIDRKERVYRLKLKGRQTSKRDLKYFQIPANYFGEAQGVRRARGAGSSVTTPRPATEKRRSPSPKEEAGRR